MGGPASKLVPVDDAKRRDAIMDAISHFKIPASDAWKDLDKLSPNTVVDAIEANTEGIFASGKDAFQATATVYVVLHFGDGRDSVSTTDAFPAHVEGSVDQRNHVKIHNFSIDTSSFYGGGDHWIKRK